MALNTDMPAWMSNQKPFDPEMLGQLAGSALGAGVGRWNTQRNPELTDMAKAEARKTPFLQSWSNAYKNVRASAQDPYAQDKWKMAQDEFKLKAGEYELRKSTWDQSVKDKAEEQRQLSRLGQWNGEGSIPSDITSAHVVALAIDKQRAAASQRAAKGLGDIEQDQNAKLNAIGSNPNVPEMIRTTALNGIMGMTTDQKARFLAQAQVQQFIPKTPALGETIEVTAGGKPATVVRTGPKTGRVVTQADTLEEKGKARLTVTEKEAELRDKWAIKKEQRQAARAVESESRKASIQLAVDTIKKLTAEMVKKQNRLTAYAKLPNDPMRKSLETSIAADEAKIRELEAEIRSSGQSTTSGGVKWRQVQ